jgi:hypothetical protein
VRRSHWAIAMAGGYATYGDYSDGVAWFYMGEPGPGRAPAQLKHLRTFFERLPFQELTPRFQLVTRGYCLAQAESLYVVYLPDGGECQINLWRGPASTFQITWFDPRTGHSVPGGKIEGRGRRMLGPPPIAGDVVALISAASLKP